MATIYKQTNAKWKNKPYKTKCTVGGSGCGLVAVTNLLVDYEKYKSATPLTFYDYMRKGAVDNDGTLRKYVQQALGHYGFSNVQLFGSRPIKDAWELLSKGYRGVFVMSGSKGGTKKTQWTTGGHYVAIVDYKYEGGKHKLKVKDSGWRNHDGWFSYEEHMRGAVADVIIGLPTKELKQTSDDTKVEKKAVETATNNVWDKSVTLLTQKKFGTPQDGVVSGQNEANKKYHVVMDSSWKYGKGGSTLVWQIQNTLGVATDGQFGVGTIKALQKALGVTADGYFGKNSLAAFKKYLNGEITLKLAPKNETTNGYKIGRLANDCAYSGVPKESKYPSGKIKSEYKVALNKAYPNRSSWGVAPRAGASCDVFVGTCVVASGVDKDFPRGLQDQLPHMEKSKKWQLVTKNPTPSDLKDGDIVIYSSKGSDPTHIMIYWKNSFKHAWLKNRWGRTTKDVASRLKGKKWIRVYRAR